MIGYVQIVSLLAAVLLFSMWIASIILGAPDSVQNGLSNAMAIFAVLQWFCALERRLDELEKGKVE